MATKAQAHRVTQQRAANPPKPKQPKRPRRDLLVDTSLPGVSATDRKAVRGTTRSKLAGRRGGAAIEEDAGPTTPSRKSTRKSADRTKRTTNQQLQAVRSTRSPSARAERSQAATTTTRGKAATSPKGRVGKRAVAKRAVGKRGATARR